ncbi:MAG: RluA family pseudouridine synthase [Candidatus Delongbacteria bacterium]|jgi:23S rRNA pseudouridine1911/1915/1917 synthase|nr:RluA family pseudouridine synthase [Candidatus Delongbacteria bacterium]
MTDIDKYTHLEEIEMTVPLVKTKQRVDKYIFSFLKNVSRNKIQQLIDSGYVSVNSESVRSNYILASGDKIHINLPRAEKKDILPEDIDLDFVYQDEYLAVINKQADLVVHPTYSAVDGTLVNALMFHFGNGLSSINGDLRPGIIHRLDKDTTGLMVVAKNDLVHSPLSDQFAEKTAMREYIGICIGRIKPAAGRVETFLKRWQKDRRIVVVSKFDGKRAVTNYETIEEFNKFSIVKFVLETGRTHQIRVHMKHLGHPLFGDKTYGGDNLKLINLPKNQINRIKEMFEILPRQALHARKLEFYHPALKKRMSFECDMPDDMKKIISLIREYEY